WGREKTRWLGDIAREAFPRAMAALEQPRPCTSCGSPLALSSRIELVAATCAHCGVVNQVAPLPVVQYYFGSCVHDLADEAAFPLRCAVEHQRVRVDRWRRAHGWAAEPLEALEEWERLERAYWQRFAEMKAHLRNEPVDTAL